MFPDSKIAKDYKCARSKGTAIVKEMSAKITLSLGERMKRLPFTISTDGSNDKGGAKLFPLVVRTVDPDTMEVRSDALSVPSIQGSATGGFSFYFFNFVNMYMNNLGPSPQISFYSELWATDHLFISLYFCV